MKTMHGYGDGFPKGEILRSRRVMLRQLGAGGLAAALAGGWMTVRAQEGSPPAVAADLPPFFADFVQAWADAAAAGDATGIGDYYAADAVFEDVPFGITLQGPDQIAGFLAGFFANYSDASVTWRTILATDDRAAAELVFAGRFTGQLPGLPPGTGQPTEVRSVHIYDFANDKIRRQTLYFDAYGLLVQLGALPAPGAPDAATPTP